ncbi:hypothetical protein ACFLX2_00070 [Candidatus Dependentiae bacterium]
MMNFFKKILITFAATLTVANSINAYPYRADHLVDQTGQFELNLFYDWHPPFCKTANDMLGTSVVVPGFGNPAEDALAFAKSRNSVVLVESGKPSRHPGSVYLLCNAPDSGVRVYHADKIRNCFHQQLRALKKCRDVFELPRKISEFVQAVGKAYQKLCTLLEEWKQEDGPDACRYYEEFLLRAQNNMFVKIWRENLVTPHTIPQQFLQEVFGHGARGARVWNVLLEMIRTKKFPEKLQKNLKDLLAWIEPELIHSVLFVRNNVDKHGFTSVDIHAGGKHCAVIRNIFRRWNWRHTAYCQSHWYHNGRKLSDYYGEGVINIPTNESYNMFFDATILAPIAISDSMFEQHEIAQVHTASLPVHTVSLPIGQE